MKLDELLSDIESRIAKIERGNEEKKMEKRIENLETQIQQLINTSKESSEKIENLLSELRDLNIRFSKVKGDQLNIKPLEDRFYEFEKRASTTIKSLEEKINMVMEKRTDDVIEVDKRLDLVEKEIDKILGMGVEEKSSEIDNLRKDIEELKISQKNILKELQKIKSIKEFSETKEYADKIFTLMKNLERIMPELKKKEPEIELESIITKLKPKKKVSIYEFIKKAGEIIE